MADQPAVVTAAAPTFFEQVVEAVGTGSPVGAAIKLGLSTGGGNRKTVLEASAMAGLGCAVGAGLYGGLSVVNMDFAALIASIAGGMVPAIAMLRKMRQQQQQERDDHKNEQQQIIGSETTAGGGGGGDNKDKPSSLLLLDDDGQQQQPAEFADGIFPEIRRIARQQLDYALEGIGDGDNGMWKLFVTDGELRMYKMKREVRFDFAKELNY